MAFNGSTANTNYVDYSQQSGGFCGIDLGAGNATVIGSIRFYPRVGYESRMMPAHSWLSFGSFQGTNQAPVAMPVISSVTSSDGRTITYHYSPYSDSLLPTVYQTLTSVSYDDGAAATYTYQQTLPATPPLVSIFQDPRYEMPFTQSKTTYFTGLNEAVGELNTQVNPLTNETLYTLSASGFSQPIITNGNNAVINIQMTDATGKYGGTTDANGAKISVGYDSHGFKNNWVDAFGKKVAATNTIFDHPLTITHPDSTKIVYTRDSSDLPLTVIDELSNKTTITRDASHRPTQIVYADTSTEAFTYNTFGQPLTRKLRNGGTASAAYDTTGLQTSSTDALGHVTQYTYDTMGRIASVTDPLSHTTGYQYDARGHVMLITRPDGSTHSYTYDTYGNKLTETDELGHTATWTYDIFNRCTSVTDALGRTTQSIFRSGYYTTKPDRVIDPAGKITVFTYDGENHVLTQTTGYGTPDASTVSYGYDVNYNVTSITDGNSHIRTYTYDTRNRKLSSTDPLGNKTQYAYDAANNVTQVTRPDGDITVNVYDKMHHLLKTTDPKSEVTTMTYDLSGNLLTRKDAKNNVYSYTYDALNRLVSLKYPDNSTEAYAYDLAGKVITYTNRAGAIKTSVFDSRNREISYTWSDGTPGVTRTFDALGRLVSSANNVSTSAYTYDAASQLLSETQTNANLGTPWPIDYTYDVDGNRTSVTYPSGTTLSYAYTGRNQVSSISNSGLSALSSQPVSAAYTYDAAGNVLTKALGDGTTATSAYDAANRLTGLNHALTGTSFAQFNYAYDVDNRRTSEQRDAAVTDNYTYDAVDQVTGVQYGNTSGGTARTVGYTYDATGNRVAVSDNVNGNSAYTTNALNQYTSVGATTYGYDTKGNLVSGNGLYIYDAQNRLMSASVGGNVDSFYYDSKNRVVQRTVNGVQVYLIYDGWNLIEERDASGNLVNTYIHGRGTDEILSKTDASGTTVYYHANALGSTANLTNASGIVVEKYTYDVFGRPSITDGSGSALTASAYGNRFLFTGREWLAEVSLYDYRNRVYSADLGRFLQSDPIGFNAGDANIYRYCGNNVTNLIDPTGNFFIGAAIGFVSGAISGAYGALAQGGNLSDAVIGAAAGGAIGALAGLVDPTEGALSEGEIIAASAAVGALAGGGGDVAGQAATELVNGSPLSINPNSVAANIAGGAIGGATGGLGDVMLGDAIATLGGGEIASGVTQSILSFPGSTMFPAMVNDLDQLADAVDGATNQTTPTDPTIGQSADGGIQVNFYATNPRKKCPQN